MRRFYPMMDEDAGGQAGGATIQADAQGTEAQQPAQTRPTFDELIKGEYKQDYDARVQAAIQARFRNQQDARRQLDAYAPIMQALGQRYGRDPGDVEGIGKLLTDDDSLYQDEAAAMGMPVGALKNIRKLEAENARMRAQEKQTIEDMQLRSHFEKISREAEALKATFPSFDLMQEINNPRFARMTSPEVGMSVKDAYYAIHGEEIRQQSMQQAAQQAGQRIAASVQAGATRPLENGTQSNAPVNMQIDIANMSKAQRAEIRKKIHSGVPVDFRSRI